MMNTKNALRGEVSEFLATTGMAKTTFGREAVGNPNFVDRLHLDGDILASTVDAARAYMATKRAEAAARKSA